MTIILGVSKAFNGYNGICDEPALISNVNQRFYGLYSTNGGTTGASGYGIVFSSNRANDGYQIWIHMENNQIKISGRFCLAWTQWPNWTTIL